jgi:DNA-binding GntR family transcriptional regulator
MPERSNSEQPYVEPVSLTDTDTYLYEAIATMEYTGQPLTRDKIKAAAGLDDAVLDAALADLTERGLLTASGSGGAAVWEPADRGWSAAPEQGQGM